MNPLKAVEIPECYRVLKIPPGSGWSEIKGAYHARALEYHPDRNYGNPHCEEQFKQVAEAFQILKEHFEKGEGYYSRSSRFYDFNQPGYEDEYATEEFSSKEDSSFADFNSYKQGGFKYYLTRLSKQLWEQMITLERSILELDVETVITLDKETASSGGTVKIRRGADYTEVRIPRGVDMQSVITIEGGGDRGILNTRRGDLRIRFQFKHDSGRPAEYHHVVEIDRQDILRRKMFALETPDGPIRYSLPANSKDGQQFTLYSAKDKKTGERKRHVISIRVRPGI